MVTNRKRRGSLRELPRNRLSAEATIVTQSSNERHSTLQELVDGLDSLDEWATIYAL
jgi:hypothetical protein